MKKSLAIGALLLAFAGAASADDLQRVQEPATNTSPPQTSTWTGFYGGINAGGAWNNGGQDSRSGNPTQTPATDNSEPGR